MKTTLLALAFSLLLASASFGQPQGYQSSSVVIGQNAEGKNLVVSVIPLRFLDPQIAAMLFGGLGFNGSATPLPAARGGEYEGARRGSGTRSNAREQGGYGGYGQGQQYPGRQSPYGG